MRGVYEELTSNDILPLFKQYNQRENMVASVKKLSGYIDVMSYNDTHNDE